MACSGYFSKNTRGELTMPRTNGRRDERGIRWEGRVTNGEVSLEKAHFDADLHARLTPRFLHEQSQFGRRMETLDPVLQFHRQG